MINPNQMINILLLQSKDYEVPSEHIIGMSKRRCMLPIFGPYIMQINSMIFTKFIDLAKWNV